MYYRCCIAVCLVIAGATHAAGQSQYTAYSCHPQSAVELGKLLRPLLPTRKDVHLVVDAEQNQLLLRGPEVVQQIARGVLERTDKQLRENLPKPIPSGAAEPSGLYITESVFAPRVDPLFRQMKVVFASRLKAITPGILFELAVRGTGRKVTLVIDRSKNRIVINGPAKVAGQLKSLLETLSTDPQEGYRVQVFQLNHSNHASLREAVRTINRDPQTPTPSARPADESRFVMPPGSMVRQTVFQVPGESAMPGGQQQLQQFEGVEIESMPDLDVILLRGRQPDLDQLAEIIQQLERISEETQPEVRILHLNNAGSQAVAEVIETVGDDLVGGRQGRVTVTPLIKPNSLLLIGWGDAVAAITKLARKLDTPVIPNTQSTVFRIKHARAEAVSTAVETFLAGREGLGPKVTIAADVRTNSVIVFAAPRDLLEVKKLIQDLDQPGGNSIRHTKIFVLQNSLASDLAETLQDALGETDQGSVLALEVMGENGSELLKSGALDQVQITPNVRNNSLIISAPIESMNLLGALVRQLDTPAGQVQLKIFQITNGDAASMVETLRSLLPSKGGNTPVNSPSVAPGETSLAPLRFSVDLRSNSIIATGSEGDLLIVEALVLRLDQTTDQPRKSTVIQLKNAPAVDVAVAINQYLLNRRQIEQAAPGEGNPFQEVEREVIVVPEPVANKLILAASVRYFDEIKSLIDKLDEQSPQVLIQVLIAEVALGKTTEFGMELGVQSSVLFDRSLLGDLLTTTNSTQNSTPGGVTTITDEIVQAASNIPGFLFNNLDPLGNSGSAKAVSSADAVGGQGISNFGVGRQSQRKGFGGLVLSANSQNVSVLLRALNETRHVRVLSRPQIRTLDNQPAFIQVGQRVPRIIGSTVNQNGQSNSISLENVGLILGVTPRVSPDNMVVMEIDAEKSKVGKEQDGIPVAVSVDGTVIRSPRVDTNTVQATVSAANGETIILGGLITEERDVTHRKVPGLQHIPILRSLFKYDADEWARTELLIILTPHVINSIDDSERLKQAELARMNWCEADVYRIHGDVNVLSGPLDTYHPLGETDETPVIYPDTNPSGDLAPVVVEPMSDLRKVFDVNDPAEMRMP